MASWALCGARGRAANAVQHLIARDSRFDFGPLTVAESPTLVRLAGLARVPIADPLRPEAASQSN